MSKETDAIEARYEDQSENEGRFQKALSQCGHGYRLQIKRMKPTWCDGLCDTWELDPNEILDLETIREEIGGRTLKLVIVNETGAFQASRTIKFPDPPRKEGKTLVRQDDDGPTASAAPTKEIVAMLLDAQKANTEILRGIMDSRLAALEARATAAPISVAPHEPRITDPMKQIRESIATIKQLEELRTGLGLGGAAAPKEPSLYEKMIEEFFNLQLEKEKNKMQALTAKAREAAKPPPDLPERKREGGNGKQPAAAPAAAPADKPATPAGLQGAKANLDQIDDLTLAAILAERYKAMTPEKKEEALSVFMGQYEWAEDDGEGDAEDLEGDGDAAEPAQTGPSNIVDLAARSSQTVGAGEAGTGVTLSDEDARILDTDPRP